MMGTTPKSIPVELEKPVERRSPFWLRFFKYIVVAVLVNGTLWSMSLGYLKKTKPTYLSQLTLNIAGSGQGVNVSLPDVGQAVTSTTSAFSSTSDPRENYKLMAMGSTILGNAAKLMDLPEKDFGEPKIKIINNTTMMEITMSGKSAEQAQKKAWAIYTALTDRLTFLRSNEQAARKTGIKEALDSAQERLTNAQLRLSNYKAQSGLNSGEQITDLISNIELLRKQRAELRAQERQSRDRKDQLTLTLGISAQDAAASLLLQTDQQFQKSLKDYSDSTIALKTLLEDRGENYPDVVVLRGKQSAALIILLERGKLLLGKTIDKLSLERLSLDNTNGSGLKRSELFQQLVLLNAEHQGLVGQLAVLSQQIQQLEMRLNLFSQKQAILDRRSRELQMAEAIFSSTLAKIDLSKSDPYGSFPLMQRVEDPNLPEKASAPKPTLVKVGAGMGSVLVTLGLTLIWWRTPILRVSKKTIRDILA